MDSIVTILPLLQAALATIAMFKGGAQEARNVQYVQDAVSVVTALTPLVQAFGAGKEVTADDVRLALARKDAALSEFDRLIAAKEAEAQP